MARRQKKMFVHSGDGVFTRLKRWLSSLKRWQKGLIIGLIVLLIAAIAIAASMAYFVSSKLDQVERVELDETQLSCVDVDGYINILLLGVDSRDMTNIQGSGADAIMILSIKEETGEVKLMSVYRDTYLQMGSTGTYGKITDANRIGGPQLVIQSLNQAMDLNINRFVIVNFKSVADLVDAVGGITVDVQEVEIEQLNKYTIQTAKNIGKTGYKLVQAPGVQTLEGVQAVSYGRIRKGVGDDYKRTERMRTVLSRVFSKLKTKSITELNEILDMMLPQVQTNLSNNDMMGMAMRMIDFNIKSGAGWPYQVTSGYLDQISYVFADDLAENTRQLHQQMFGQMDYVPSETVQYISDAIDSIIYGSVTQQQEIDTSEQQETPVVEEPEETAPVEEESPPADDEQDQEDQTPEDNVDDEEEPKGETGDSKGPDKKPDPEETPDDEDSKSEPAPDDENKDDEDGDDEESGGSASEPVTKPDKVEEVEPVPEEEPAEETAKESSSDKEKKTDSNTENDE